MKTKLFILLSLCLILMSFAAADSRKPVIFMIGDSTMANKDTTGGNPERGWGMVLNDFLTDDIVVDNHAVNGRSTKSFIDEGRWSKVLDKLHKGDYVVIQFGHNDEKPNPDRHTDPGTTFDANLTKFVNETRAKGATPILMNAIVRRNWVGDTLVDTHGAYREAPRKVAKDLNVAFVDMNRLTEDLLISMGVEDSKRLFVWFEPNTLPFAPKGKQDNTHLNVYGAHRVAKIALNAMIEVVPQLAQYRRRLLNRQSE